MNNYNSIYKQLESKGYIMKGGNDLNNGEHTFFIDIPSDFTEFNTDGITEVFKNYNVVLKDIKIFPVQKEDKLLVHIIASY
jgi:hypothetical protein